MKTQFFLLFFFCAFFARVPAQTIIPAAKSFKVDKGTFLFELKRNSFQNNDTLQEAFKRDSSNLTRYNKGNEKRLNRTIDSLRKVYLDSDYTLQIPSIINELNSSPTVKPIITAGLTNLENTNQSYGSLSAGLLFRLSRYRVWKNDWIDPHYIYLMFSTKTATSSDSSSIQKTFMFPELNKRDFVLGYFCEIRKGDWSIAPTFEFSLNRFIDTSNNKNFVSQSVTAGVRIQKAFTTS